MKKIFLISSLILCFTFVGQAFAVGGPQTFIVTANNKVTGQLFFVEFRSTSVWPSVYDLWSTYNHQNATWAHYTSHKTMLYSISSTSHNGRDRAVINFDSSCNEFNFREVPSGYKKMPGYWLSRQVTAHGFYVITFTLEPGKKHSDAVTLYCYKKALD